MPCSRPGIFPCFPRAPIPRTHLTEENEHSSIIVQAGAQLRHVHVSNPRGRVFPLSADELDYAPFFRALNRIGYHGIISSEARTDNFAVEGPAAVSMIQAKAVAFICSGCTAAGR